jgi:hypothetical protein
MTYDEGKFRQYLALKAEFGEQESPRENPLASIHQEFEELHGLIKAESKESRKVLANHFRRVETVLLYAAAIVVVGMGLEKSGNPIWAIYGFGAFILILGSRHLMKGE